MLTKVVDVPPITNWYTTLVINAATYFKSPVLLHFSHLLLLFCLVLCYTLIAKTGAYSERNTPQNRTPCLLCRKGSLQPPNGPHRRARFVDPGSFDRKNKRPAAFRKYQLSLQEGTKVIPENLNFMEWLHQNQILPYPNDNGIVSNFIVSWH